MIISAVGLLYPQKVGRKIKARTLPIVCYFEFYRFERIASIVYFSVRRYNDINTTLNNTFLWILLSSSSYLYFRRYNIRLAFEITERVTIII